MPNFECSSGENSRKAPQQGSSPSYRHERLAGRGGIEVGMYQEVRIQIEDLRSETSAPLTRLLSFCSCSSLASRNKVVCLLSSDSEAISVPQNKKAAPDGTAFSQLWVRLTYLACFTILNGKALPSGKVAIRM